MPTQAVGQQLNVTLRPQDVISGFFVARFGKMGERPDAQALRKIVLGHPFRHFGLERRIPVLQPIARLLGFELRIHPSQHHGRLDRLGDIVGGAELKTALFVVDPGERRQENHRNVASVRIVAQTGKHRVPVHPGHHHVEQDQFRLRKAEGDAQTGLP